MFIDYLSRLIDPLAEHPIERPPGTVLPFFFYFFSPVKKILLFTLTVSGIAAISEMALYVFLGKLVDWMGASTPDTFFNEYGTALMLMLLVAAVVRPLALLVSRGMISLAITPCLGNRVRWQNHRYVIRQSLSFFQNDFAGRVAQKVMQTGHSMRELVINIIDGSWMLLIYVVGIVWLFAAMDWRLLWPIALWALCFASVVAFQVPPVRKKSAALSEVNAELLGRIVDAYSNIQSVKLFAQASDEDAHAEEMMRRHTHTFQTLMKAIFGMTASMTLLNTFLVVSVAATSVWLWHAGAVSLGEIAVANGLILRLNQMSGWILRTITQLFEGVGQVQNGIDTLAQENTVQDAPNAKALKFTKGDIRFENVHFRYGDEQHVVRDFNLHIRAGEKVGLVGRSGAGKSTLVNLLLRFYDVDGGQIRLDGQSIADVTQESLRHEIAMVTQDTALLHRSVRDNIAYGSPTATEAEIIAAAKLAEADRFIPDLSDPQGRRGYDALVGERGVKLSGGQRQRIAIARVILKNAPILVLDEATSALDSEVEEAIQSQLQKLMAGKTVIAIAHRLSTIAALDRLVVIDEGRIVEQGSHEALIAQGGLYARLWQRQSGGFLAHDLSSNSEVPALDQA